MSTCQMGNSVVLRNSCARAQRRAQDLRIAIVYSLGFRTQMLPSVAIIQQNIAAQAAALGNAGH